MSDPASAPRYSKLLRPLQDAITDRLASFAPFANVPVLDRRRKNLKNDLQAATSKLGIYLFVLPPIPRGATSGSGLWFRNVECAVHIFENPALNRTGVDVFDAWELVIERLDGFKPDNGLNALFAAENPFEDESTDDVLRFNAIFGTDGGLAPAPDLS